MRKFKTILLLATLISTTVFAAGSTDLGGGGGIPTAEKGAPNGVATLDGTGKVPNAELPAGAGSVLSVTGTGPISTTDPTVNPIISCAVASTVQPGCLAAANFTTFNNKEPAITAGTTLQYYRGDKTFQTLDTLAVPENTNLYYTQARFDTAFAAKSTTNLSEGSNLYFTNARAIAATLTGYVSGAGVISAADSILSAIQKLNGNIAAVVGSAITSLTGDATATGPGAAALTLATVNGSPGSFTNASITVNGKGLVTAASSGTAPVTSVGGTAPVVSSGGTTPVISMAAATNAVNGYLTSADHTTYSNASSQVNGGPSKVLYVDQNQPGGFTADGSILRPFVHIMDAVNQIIANNDGLTYLVLVAPGTYAENITLNDTAFTRLAIAARSQADGGLSNDASTLTSITGDIISTSNNDNFKSFLLRGFDIQGNINFVGASTGTNFCQYICNFDDDVLYSTGASAIIAQNAGQIVFNKLGSAIQSGAGAVAIQNVNSFLAYNSFLNLGSFSLVTNNGVNKPSGFGGTSAQTSFGNIVMPITIDAGSALTQRYERVNTTINNSGALTSINSIYQNTVTNSGTWNSNNDSENVVHVNSGTFNANSTTYSAVPRAINALLTGYVSGAGVVAATDSILQAIQKLNGNAAAISGSAITSLTGDVTATGPGAAAATIANLAVTNAKIANATIDLTAKVTGILPIANGGTNSSSALNNNRVMKSSGGAIVEAAAITANRALASDANGIPVASSTTDTELGYVSGVTSSIQTQLNGKLSKTPNVVDGGDAAYSILAADYHVRSGTTLTADRTYTLPACAANIGEQHEIKNLPAQTFNIILAGNGGDLIDGAASFTIYPSHSLKVICAVSGTWDLE